mmetsp:Transcript_20421/g.24543  ORF Transcript_20421/g.24543 Transcript_20421/m.24543 type:complete len:172 (+) Transcript_20421:114-629(+)|eukprot:CAMPEP_0195327096 /NCGR_PEP_ID=MMETSP0708-20121125/10064_1 /TAXON_ID=33640 /ORGANISM="Asterionellopsis glacialis, Strain CCMP134" /LENGTH=171 /DNA_ID=CAMNT_0040394769 /DNA_START=75 /DNA_END=590 /DNA_ORIENTATION=+
MKLLVFFSLLLCQTSAFLVPSTTKVATTPVVVGSSRKEQVAAAALSKNSNDIRTTVDHPTSRETQQQQPQQLPNNTGSSRMMFSSMTGLGVAALSSSPMVALAQVDPDDYEIAQLPPVWVPAVFAVALLIGVGVLTSSLGDVMSEEASLGMQSGARAKKEMERNRSSYFKK